MLKNSGIVTPGPISSDTKSLLWALSHSLVATMDIYQGTCTS